MPSDVLKYLCPVCGFLLPYPPRDFNICPSCGTEFGADTVEHTVSELQQAWINRGMGWTSAVIAKPEHYNPIEQLSVLNADSETGQTSAREEIVLDEPPLKIGPKSAASVGTMKRSIA
jgi:hypothetical protein